MSIFFVAAHALVVNSEKKVLVTKRAKCNDYMPLKWDIPGGTVEPGETVEEALIRELKEETNIAIVPLHPVYVYSNLSQLPKRQTVQIVFTCKYIEGEITLNPEEHDEYRWIDFSELKNLECIAFLDDLKARYKSIYALLPGHID